MNITYLAVKNWRKFQMYRVDDPRWIKLHVCILDDKKVQALSPLTRLLWYQILPLAARYQNAIPKNMTSIAKETRLERHTVTKGIEKLLQIDLLRETKTSRRIFDVVRKPPAELMEAFIQNGGYELTTQSLLEEMRERGVGESEHDRLLEMAKRMAA